MDIEDIEGIVTWVLYDDVGSVVGELVTWSWYEATESEFGVEWCCLTLVVRGGFSGPS